MFRKISLLFICFILVATAGLLLWSGSYAKEGSLLSTNVQIDQPEQKTSLPSDWMILASLARIITDVTTR